MNNNGGIYYKMVNHKELGFLINRKIDTVGYRLNKIILCAILHPSGIYD